MSDTQTPHPEWDPESLTPKKKRRWALWVSIPAAIVVVAVAAASLVLIAPGTAVAGVPVGGMTPGDAAATISNRLARTTLSISTPKAEINVTGGQLGASVDASALAAAALGDRPLWNVTAWNGSPVAATVHLDETQADAALSEALGSQYIAPIDATVRYDAATHRYVSTDAVDGSGITVNRVQNAMTDAFASGRPTTHLSLNLEPLVPTVTTAMASALATHLNHVLDTVGFYVGAERTVPVNPDTAASWLTIGPGLTVTADAALIQKSVDTLAAAVNRAPVDTTIVTDLNGKKLGTLTPGVEGRTLGSTATIASRFANQLSAGGDNAGIYTLTDVTSIAPGTTSLARSADVNLTTLTATFSENGKVVMSFPISPGKPSTPTPTGHFTVFAHVPLQDMGCYPGSTESCTKDVPWVTYFAPDIAFHGAYWHNMFGIAAVSHGCVNMRISDAKTVYDWLYEGTPVNVRN